MKRGARTGVAIAGAVSIAVFVYLRRSEPPPEPATSAPAPSAAEPAAARTPLGVPSARPDGREANLTGIVTDVGGGPIVGAKVVVERGPLRVSAETDSEGRFAVAVAATQVIVRASAVGYAREVARADVPGKVQLRLTPAASIRGRVVESSSGLAVGDAEVVAEGKFETRSTRTDAEGRFQLSDLSPGSYRTWARTERLAGAADRLSLTAGESVEVELRLVAARAIEGRVVVAGQSSAVCPGGTFALFGRHIASAITEIADGRVRVTGLLPDQYAVELSCPGFFVRAVPPPLVVADEDRTGLTWEVERGCTIAGRVTRGGAPVEGAAVRIHDSEAWVARSKLAERGLVRWLPTTDTAGAFTLEGMRPGELRLVVVDLQETQTATLVDVPSTCAAPMVLELAMDAPSALRGRVIDTGGAGVSGATVWVTGREGSAMARTDGEGRFEACCVAAGSVAVRLLRDEDIIPIRGAPNGFQKRLTLVSGASNEVELVAESHEGAIRGTVVDARRAPAPGVWVSCRGEAPGLGGQPQIRTDPDGRFACEGLGPVSYRVCAGRHTCRSQVEVGATIELVLMEPASVSGRVVGAARMDALTIVAMRADGRGATTQQIERADGAWRLDDLTPGAYVIRADVASASGSVDVELGPDERREGVLIRLRALGAIHGRTVSARDGRPLAASVSIGGIADEPLTRESGADGRFRLEGVRPGVHRLSAGAPDGCTSSRSVRLEDAGELDVGDVQVALPRAKYVEAGEVEISFVLHETRGHLVARVTADGPAERAGLRDGDEIVAIDGVTTDGDATRAWCLTWVPPGASVKFTRSGGDTVQVVADPRER